MLKTRPAPQFRIRWPNDNGGIPIDQLSESIDWGPTGPTGKNYCRHYKVVQYASPGQINNDPDDFAYVDNIVGDFPVLAYLAKNGVPMDKTVYAALDFLENNDFGIIQTLAELDETLAMFTKKFITQFSYGAWTWGVVPFLSDLKALYGSLKDLSTRFDDYSKPHAIRKRFPVNVDLRGVPSSIAGNHVVNATIKGSYSLSGRVFLNPLRGKLGYIQRVIEELGVHPDLATAWDLVPLSFVVDYFLPVGDYLESLKPRGWFNPTFSGWASLKADISYTLGAKTPFTTIDTNRCRGSAYIRDFLIGAPIALYKPPRVELDAPNLRQLFNTSYLAGGNKLERKVLRR